MENKKISHKQYWEENIQGYSGFYDKGSEERIYGPSFLTSFYRKCIFPIEQRVTKQRFNAVMEYIQKNVHAGTVVADIGCGGGVFTEHMASLGAKVYAIDYAQNSLALTAKRLSKKEAYHVEFLNRDIVSQNIPKVDASIAIGVLPYIDDPVKFFDHVLPFTGSLFFNFLDKKAILNILRQKVGLLDVRGYSYQGMQEIRNILLAAGFDLVEIKKLGLGFLVEAQRRAGLSSQ